MRYIPNSPEERAEMLHQVGLNSADDLFDSIPRRITPNPRPRHTRQRFRRLNCWRNLNGWPLAIRLRAAISFLGAGAYSHYIPTIVDHIISRSEFFTAYTPYQPEISQGTLQVIFEFQTLVCQLTGMDVANASMYDGSTALAEAVLMAERVTKRSKVIACGAIHPEYLEVVHTYVQHAGIELQHVGTLIQQSGQVPARIAHLDDQTAAIVVQSPNFFGCIEDRRRSGGTGARRRRIADCCDH